MIITSSMQDQVESPGTMADIEAALVAGYRVTLFRTDIEHPLYVAEMVYYKPYEGHGRTQLLRSDTNEGLCREVRRLVRECAGR